MKRSSKSRAVTVTAAIWAMAAAVTIMDGVEVAGIITVGVITITATNG